MKKISEMTLEELQDHAINQQEQIKTLQEENAKSKTQIDEMNALNKNLQKRNNDLFVKLEQQGKEPENEPGKEPEKQIQSCEEFAKNYVLGGNK